MKTNVKCVVMAFIDRTLELGEDQSSTKVDICSCELLILDSKGIPEFSIRVFIDVKDYDLKKQVKDFSDSSEIVESLISIKLLNSFNNSVKFTLKKIHSKELTL